MNAFLYSDDAFHTNSDGVWPAIVAATRTRITAQPLLHGWTRTTVNLVPAIAWILYGALLTLIRSFAANPVASTTSKLAPLASALILVVVAPLAVRPLITTA